MFACFFRNTGEEVMLGISRGCFKEGIADGNLSGFRLPEQADQTGHIFKLSTGKVKKLSSLLRSDFFD